MIVGVDATSFSGQMSQDLLEELLAVIKVERVTHRRKALPYHLRNGMRVKLYVLIAMYKVIMHDHVPINKNHLWGDNTTPCRRVVLLKRSKEY